MKTKDILGFALLLGIGLFSNSQTARAGELAADTQEVVAGNTQFAMDLYGKLRTGEGNLFFSPYSISTALAMACGGARGKTEKQMAHTLHFDLSKDKLFPAFANLEADLGAVQQKGQAQIAVANSLWPQTGLALLPDYVELCQKYFHTSITSVDYFGQTEAARKTINDWVEARTNQKIVDLLKPGALDAATRLVLVNAIYFKGKWAGEFKTNRTQIAPFHVTVEKSVTASLMQQSGDFPYAETPGLQVLELPYAGNDLSLLVLLPEVEKLGALESELTPQNLTAWTRDLQSQKVNASLPKFKVTSEFSLAQTLKTLGISDAFNLTRADFSGMDGGKNLAISDVIHKAFVEVNEAGTEAAAATAVAMIGRGMSPPAPVFRADHPFLFLIRDNRNGSILFLGRVTDPTK